MDINQELAMRILSDERPPQVDALYLFGQTEQNQYSVLDAGTEAFDSGWAPRILLSGAGMISGYPGAKLWKTILMTRGVAPESIHVTEAKELNSINTFIEAELLVDLCKYGELKSVAVCAAPFHQERAFISAVSVAQKNMPELSVYSYVGRPLPWNQETVHSQGTLKKTRKELLSIESEKVDKYHDKGDLLSREQVLKYLDVRSSSC